MLHGGFWKPEKPENPWLNSDKELILSLIHILLKGFGSDQIALVIGIEGINGGHFGIGEGLRYQRTIRLVDLECSARIRDGIAGFRIHLDDFDEGLEVGVVDEITVDLTICRNQNIKIGNQLTTCLLYTSRCV